MPSTGRTAHGIKPKVGMTLAQLRGMHRRSGWRRAISFAGLAGALLLASGARATEREWPRRISVAIEGGYAAPPQHLLDIGIDAVIAVPHVYLAVVADGRVLPYLHVDGQLGINSAVGWMASLSARLAEEVSRVTLSVGVGPLVTAAPANGGPSPWVDANGSAIVHFDSQFIIMLRAGGAWALANRGSPHCGTDTCDPYLVRGDHALYATAGIGFSFL